MKFEWDERKRRENIQKHGIDFADVPAIFDSPILERLDDRLDYGEDRWIAIGMLAPIVVVAVYVERLNGEQNVIRIISARKANYYERTEYERYLQTFGN